MASSLEPVSIPALPQSIEEFVARHDQVAATPQGGAAMMVVALLLHAGDEELGRQCLAAAVDESRLAEVGAPQQMSRLDQDLIRTQLTRQPYLPQSYIQGATPENGYALPELPYRLAFTSNRHSGDPASGRFKVFVACSGAATPRPVAVRQNQAGLWKALEWSSLVVGIRRPESPA